MPKDLSYLKQLNGDLQRAFDAEAELKKAVEEEILKAIVQYLNEVADTMKANNIECLNEPTVRAMAGELSARINSDAEQSVAAGS